MTGRGCVTFICTFFLNGLFIWTLSVAQVTSANPTIRVMPADGGSSLQLGRVGGPSGFDREVSVRISNAGPGTYQVFQRLQEPFTNQQGQMLDRSALEVSALVGSNSSGTLYPQTVERVTSSDQLIYSSDSSGQADTFTLIYHVNPDYVPTSGQYVGRVVFTVRPVSGGFADQTVLNVYFDVESNLEIRARTESGGDDIRLSSGRVAEQQSDVVLDISGVRGRSLYVRHEVLQAPVHEDGEILPSEAVSLETVNALTGDQRVWPGIFASPSPERIVESARSDEQVIARYQLHAEAVPWLRAGEYRGLVRMTVQADDQQRVFDYNIFITIDPIFELDVSYPSEGMRFTHVLPNMPPVSREVRVSVRSNTGRPYTITQDTLQLLTNEEGQQIQESFFTVHVEPVGEVPGRIQTASQNSVKVGNETLYVSDIDGRPVDLKVIYTLSPYVGIQPGKYDAPVMFTLGVQ